LDKDFLYNYIPGELTIQKVIEDFGQPLTKMKDFAEQDLNTSKVYEIYVYKYRFLNAVVLFSTELKDNNVISISLISKLDKKYPISCRYSFEEDDKNFGEAKISEIIIRDSLKFVKNNYATWNYTAITSSYFFRPIKHLRFTYFLYNLYEDKIALIDEPIDGISISVMDDINPIVHFDDYIFN